jgi:hypothetical protein
VKIKKEMLWFIAIMDLFIAVVSFIEGNYTEGFISASVSLLAQSLTID